MQEKTYIRVSANVQFPREGGVLYMQPFISVSTTAIIRVATALCSTQYLLLKHYSVPLLTG